MFLVVFNFFYRVPRDQATSKPLDEWEKSIRAHVDEKNVDLNGLVCIEHFLESDITKSNTLKKFALPTIFDSTRSTRSTLPIAFNGVQAVQGIKLIQKKQIPDSPEMLEELDSIDSIDSIDYIRHMHPTHHDHSYTASDGAQAADKSQGDQIQSNPSGSCPSCQNYRVQLIQLESLKKLQKEYLIEKTNNNIQMYKLEDKNKSLQTTVANQTTNIKRLNKEINRKVESSEKLQRLVKDLQQQIDLNTANEVEMKTLKVCNNSSFIDFCRDNMFIA